jgi:hypothetical protein
VWGWFRTRRGASRRSRPGKEWKENDDFTCMFMATQKLRLG